MLRVTVVVLLAAALAWALWHRNALTVSVLRTHLDALGAWAPVVFIAGYTVAAVVFLPGSVFTIAAGVFFGPWLGTIYALLGATLGATSAFLIARYLAAEWVARRAGGRLARVIDGVEHEGWRFVALTRLVPVFPFNLLNYVLGLTRIPVAQYMLASLVCMAPGALAYAWIGHAGATALAGGHGMIRAVLIALALFAVVAFVPRLIRRIRNVPAVEREDER